MDQQQNTPGDTPVTVVLDRFRDAGHAANHLVRPDGEVQCGECGTASPANRWTIAAQHRVEGASDPDALQLVVGLRCPACDTDGAIVLSYGPAASEDDAAVLTAIALEDASDPLG